VDSAACSTENGHVPALLTRALEFGRTALRPHEVAGVLEVTAPITCSLSLSMTRSALAVNGKITTRAVPRHEDSADGIWLYSETRLQLTAMPPLSQSSRNKIQCPHDCASSRSTAGLFNCWGWRHRHSDGLMTGRSNRPRRPVGSGIRRSVSGHPRGPRASSESMRLEETSGPGS
jgi:hypothetical protein